MTRRSFDAWHLPAWADPPVGAVMDPMRGGLVLRVAQGDVGWVGEVVRGLEARREALLGRSLASIIEALGTVGARLLDPEDPLRAEALDVLPGSAGLSPAMASAVLDGMASDWTADRLRGLVSAEFADPEVLDTFVTGSRSRLRAFSPGVCIQIVAGSVPGVGATALVRSLLTKAPTLLKPGRGDVVLPVLFARALEEADPDLGQAVAVVYWRGGQGELETAALQGAGVVTAYGGDEAVRSIRDRTPVSARFVAYHHRVSFGVVGRDALTPALLHRTASAFFDQRGCVSPHVLTWKMVAATMPRSSAGLWLRRWGSWRAIFREVSWSRRRVPGSTRSAGLRSSELPPVEGSRCSTEARPAGPWSAIPRPASSLSAPGGLSG